MCNDKLKNSNSCKTKNVMLIFFFFLCVCAGAPAANLPMKMVVEGSPLSLKREALGLDMSGPEPLLSFGEVSGGVKGRSDQRRDG